MRMHTHLVEDLLQVGGAQPVGHVTIRCMAQEELPLSCHGSLDILLAVDVLLTAVDHTHIAWGWEKQQPWRVTHWLHRDSTCTSWLSYDPEFAANSSPTPYNLTSHISKPSPPH